MLTNPIEVGIILVNLLRTLNIGNALSVTGAGDKFFYDLIMLEENQSLVTIDFRENRFPASAGKLPKIS